MQLIEFVAKTVSHGMRLFGNMYAGELVEVASRAEFFSRPKHPYTQALISAVPVVDPDAKRQRIILAGDVPSPIHPPGGCPFHPRCPVAEARCRTEVPPLHATGAGRQVAAPVQAAAPYGGAFSARAYGANPNGMRR